jgi:hypothetical protein
VVQEHLGKEAQEVVAFPLETGLWVAAAAEKVAQGA